MVVHPEQGLVAVVVGECDVVDSGVVDVDDGTVADVDAVVEEADVVVIINEHGNLVTREEITER